MHTRSTTPSSWRNETTTIDAADVLAAWADDGEDRPDLVRAVLGDVPTALLLSAKSHVDNVVREFVLLSIDEIGVEPLAPRLQQLLAAIEQFSDARLAIKQQALARHARGDATTRLELLLPVAAAPKAEEYLVALDEIDAYCRAGRLLTMETPPQHKLFRHWYVEVGGDFYDVWPIADDEFAIAIGDTAGTGLLAAALSALVRHTARAVAAPEVPPTEVVRRLDRALLLNNGNDSEQFCTAIAGRLRPTEGGASLDVTSGGHMPILIRRCDGTVEHHLVGGLPLGLFDDPQPQSLELALRSGDAALLYSDGVVEAHDGGGRMFGFDGLDAAFGRADGDAAAMVAAVEAAVLEHTSSVPTDDMVALVFRIPAA